jgi:hypothetical protein
MTPFGKTGVPSPSIVVRAGKEAYMIHPAGPKFVGGLKKEVGGKFNAAAESNRAGQEKKLQKQFEDYLMATAGARDEATAKAMGAELYETIKDNPVNLFTMGVRIVFWEAARYRDKELAVKAMDRAAELTANKEPAILAVQAGAYYLKGDAAKAKELEAKAMELAPSEDMKRGIKSDLDRVRPK